MSPIVERPPATHNIPSDALAAPEAVSKALAAAREAGALRDQCVAEHRAAVAATKQAEAADAAADTEAVAAGDPLPKGAGAGAKAKAAADAARRRAEASERVYAEHFAKLTEAIVEHRGEWHDLLAEQLASDRSEALEALAKFEAAFTGASHCELAIEALTSFSPGAPGAWRGARFNLAPRHDQNREKRRAKRLAVISNTRRIPTTPSEVDHVLVDLELLASGRRPWEREAEHEEAA